MSDSLQQLVLDAAERVPDSVALIHADTELSYAALGSMVEQFASALIGAGFSRYDRVAVYLPKQPPTVAAMFGCALAGGIFVPVNPILKADQVQHIVQDCDVRVLVTTTDRYKLVSEALHDCQSLESVVLVDQAEPEIDDDTRLRVVGWDGFLAQGTGEFPRYSIDSDPVSILYTSGSTGKPKGVVLSHRNMVVGARSVAEYIGNGPDDRILSVLPLSFDAGLSQLTTGFHAHATVVLFNYVLPQDVIKVVRKQAITGITGVPPLWIQVSELEWPDDATSSLRYFANTGGKMPRSTLQRLRQIFPQALPFLMYGLTESFRSTYLPPQQVDQRPDSIGKAIPNAEVLIVRDDGTLCGPNEPGELVHRGPLVSLGYWNDPERTAHRFRPTPQSADGVVMPELAVWSGDSVQMDDDGFIYFIGRLDDMIKSSGYRVSPTEIEEVAHASGLVGEVVAFGVPHPKLGQAIVLAATPVSAGEEPTEQLLRTYQRDLPNFMVPKDVLWRSALPRNSNGKMDRRALMDEQKDLYADGK